MNAKRQEIKEEQIQGLKHFKVLTDLLADLHDAGCQRDRAGNRELFMDQYMALLLLYMFNPICGSLRALQQASELKNVQKKLGVSRSSLGSLSEAARVFDSSLMHEIVEHLAEKLKPINSHQKLAEVNQIITLVDGTSLSALRKLTCAAWDKTGVKAHTQFDLEKYVPTKMTLTENHGNEKEQLKKNLQPGRLYVQDRGYACFALFEAILGVGSSFVCRVRDDTGYELLQTFPLSQEAVASGIVLDRKVLIGSNDRLRGTVSQPLRLIAIDCQVHSRLGQGPAQGQTILIATDRFDLDADVIALMYKKRWAIETFFRFFKHVLGCRHLLSYCDNGIELQTYAAIIACMLISLWTGRKPSQRTYEMICYVFTGLAELKELLTHIQKLPASK
jgi:Transposase DDE domain